MIEKWKVFSKPAQHSRAQPIVAVENVSVIYNTTHALDNISFRLEVGERVAVVGPNGAGKSTLFKVIAGLLSPTRGKTHISGSDPSGHICIAYIPQRSQMDWAFPVNVSDVVMMGRIRNIGLFHHPGRSDYEVVREALQVVGMENLATRQIGELSGGQQQRVFIARALAQEAELMLLDEPLTGLDIRSQEDIMAILEALRGRVTVMIATHDLSLAATSFDRLMLLNRRLIGFGTAQEVLTTERLAAAYGGQMHVVPTQEGLVTFDDACCDGGHTHHD